MNKKNIASAFTKYASSYTGQAKVQAHVGESLVQLCAQRFPAFDSILDIGTGTGVLLPSLHHAYPDAKLYCNDISETMLSVVEEAFPYVEKSILGDAETIALPYASLYISNFAFQWFTSLPQTVSMLWNSCDVLAFTCLTKNTFMQWRELCEKYGLHCVLHSYPTITEMTQYIGALPGASFSIQEESREMVFSTPASFLRYLKLLGASTPSVPVQQSIRKILTLKEEFITQYQICTVVAWKQV